MLMRLYVLQYLGMYLAINYLVRRPNATGERGGRAEPGENVQGMVPSDGDHPYYVSILAFLVNDQQR